MGRGRGLHVCYVKNSTDIYIYGGVVMDVYMYTEEINKPYGDME